MGSGIWTVSVSSSYYFTLHYTNSTDIGYTIEMTLHDFPLALWPSVHFFFTSHRVSGKQVLSGPTGHIPWNTTVTLCLSQSETDAILMHQSIHLSLRLCSLTRYDYCMILMKYLAWIQTRRNLTNLYMTSVRSIDLPLFWSLKISNRSTLHAFCSLTTWNLTLTNTK